VGVNESPSGVFRGPLSYSPDLSKFIKMAQILVVQGSVVAAEEGEVDHPSDLIRTLETYSNVAMWQKVIEMLRAKDSIGNAFDT
jgi:hypothetical protein